MMEEQKAETSKRAVLRPYRPSYSPPCAVDVHCLRCDKIYTVEIYRPGRDYICICGNAGKI